MLSEPFRIFLHLTHSNAVTLHRNIYPAKYCEAPLRREGIEILTSKEMPETELVAKYHAVCSHGMLHPLNLSKYCRWQEKGMKFICSLDDDYTCLPSWNPIKFKAEQFGAFYWATKNADFINCSTQALADTMPKNQYGKTICPTFVTPNMLEPHLYAVPEGFREKRHAKRKLVRILWCGSNTHLGDLEQMVEPVTTILNKYGTMVEFVFWGEIHPLIRQRHLYNGVVELEGCALADYFHFLRDIAPEIMVCPLDNCKFNASKSNLKILEAWGVGAGVVASPVLPYSETIRHGDNGFLAGTTDEWVESLSRLIEDDELRTRIGRNGNQEVHDKYNWTNPKCIEPWMNLFRAVAGRG